MFASNKSRILVFNNKNKTRKRNFLTKKLEISHKPLKTRNGCFINLKSRWIPQRIKEVSN